MGYFGLGSISQKNKIPPKPILKKILLVLTALAVFNLVFFYIPSKFSDEASENSQGQDEDSNFPSELSENSLQLIQHGENDHPVNKLRYRKNWKSDGNVNSNPKKILLWNAYWESTAMWHKIFFEIVYKQCPQSKCVMTVDKSELEHSDAVLFHLVGKM